MKKVNSLRSEKIKSQSINSMDSKRKTLSKKNKRKKIFFPSVIETISIFVRKKVTNQCEYCFPLPSLLKDENNFYV